MRKQNVSKSSVRLILGVFVVFSLITAIIAGHFIYVTRYKTNVVASSASPDGQYELLFQQIGEPEWPFGYTHAGLVLKDESKTVAKLSFDVANDGGIIDAENWNVTWKESYVEAVISGEEQNDNQFIGITFTISTDKLTFLLFLAVNPKLQSQGYGGQIIERLKNKCVSKDIALNMEIVDKEAKNYVQRLRRLKFYERHGFTETNYILKDSVCDYSIMNLSSDFNADECSRALGLILFGLIRPKLDYINAEEING